MKKILTIAGSDSSGGAGIQADIKTITAHKMYAMSAITALTAQNTLGVQSIFSVSKKFVAEQLDSIFTDIYPDAIKIGMVSNPDIITVITKKLIQYQAKNIVIDPVMVSTSGSSLLQKEALAALREQLLPLATIITPNIPEAEILCSYPIHTKDDMKRAALWIANHISNTVLIKGGHLERNAEDILCVNNQITLFSSPYICTSNTHGTGCTLSSAIACNLAKNLSIEESIQNAKSYLTGALKANLNLGTGNGPLEHTYCLTSSFF